MRFGNFIEQAEAEQEDPKAKRLKMIKRQVLQKKVQAVRQGAGEDIVASYEPEGEMVEGYQRNPERDTRSAKQKRMDDPDTGINSAKFRAFMAAQQKPSKKKVDEHHQKDKDGKVIEHEDTTPCSVEEELSRRSKPSAKAKMAKLDAVLKRREERKIAEKEALKTEGWLGKKKKEEKKPEKAMDAGARAKRKLQRREYASKVSGSEDNVPDEMREGVGGAVKAVGKAAGKTLGFAAKSAAGVVGHGINALNQPGYKPKPKAGSTAKKSAGLSAAQSQAEKANKARLDAKKKAVKKIKDDRRERATNIMTAEKAAKKVKKEGEDKKFKADSEKPIVAEFVDHLWEASKKRKKKGCAK